jgi:hypothetical protein
LSSDDVSDIAQEFGVKPDQLNALAQTPEFQRMVAQELARRVGELA